MEVICGIASRRQVSILGLWLLLICLLNNADQSDGWKLRSDRGSAFVTGGGRRLLEGTPVSTPVSGNPGCPEGLVGWVNCGSTLDPTTQVCINGYICPMGQELCDVTCYNPTSASCFKGSLSSSVGAGDGSGVQNCTLPIPYEGPVACSGDGCPIETGAPLAPEPAPAATTAAALPAPAAAPEVATTTTGGNPGCPSGQVGWANCASTLDTSKQSCINGHTCSAGQYLCGATCYDPASSSCVGGSVSSTKGIDDGSETRNCTVPAPFVGSVACSGDGCPIETGPPLAPAPAPAVSSSAAATALSNPQSSSANSAKPTTGNSGSSEDGGGGSNIGAIVGGAVGGAVGLAVLAAAVALLMRRRRAAKKPLEFQSMKKEIAFQDMPEPNQAPA